MTIKTLAQRDTVTTIECPKCRKGITLFHGDAPEIAIDAADYNSGIGNLHMNEQNYTYIVCQNARCDWAGDVHQFEVTTC